jgi:hypothetical protein
VAEREKGRGGRERERERGRVCVCGRRPAAARGAVRKQPSCLT